MARKRQFRQDRLSKVLNVITFHTFAQGNNLGFIPLLLKGP